MHVFQHVSDFLLQAAQVATAGGTYPDTIITKQVTAEPGVFEKITSIASTLMTVAMLALAVGLIPAAMNFRRTFKKVNDLLDKVYGDFAPLVRSASVVTEDAREIVASIKGDARLVQQTVAAANTRLLKAVRQAEERIDQFNALIEVIQEEAESTFVTTAATVRGVRTGVSQIFDTNDGDDDGNIGDERAPFAQPTRPSRPRPRVKPRTDDEGFA
jgi:uncharacterized protein YoxC